LGLEGFGHSFPEFASLKYFIGGEQEVQEVYVLILKATVDGLIITDSSKVIIIIKMSLFFPTKGMKIKQLHAFYVFHNKTSFFKCFWCPQIGKFKITHTFDQYGQRTDEDV
jgi:hypothetical protein